MYTEKRTQKKYDSVADKTAKDMVVEHLGAALDLIRQIHPRVDSMLAIVSVDDDGDYDVTVKVNKEIQGER